MNEKYKSLFNKNTVSLHIRRGDYVNLSDHHLLLDISYYKNAVNMFKNIEKVVVFSDDIEWCKENLDIKNTEFIENETDIVDLYLMSQCTHNIIANSSFSWWGAWLNKNDNKKVIAPKKWFGPKRNDLNDKDIIPETWIRI